MTEERYSLDHTVVPQPLIREHGVCMEIGVVVDKLNMLSEERNQFQFQYNMEVLKRQSLEKENEKLKGSLNFCKKNVKRLHDDKKELINKGFDKMTKRYTQKEDDWEILDNG